MKINYKSDFDIILTLKTCVRHEDGTCSKRDVGWPEHDWVATFRTENGLREYVASRKGDTLVNCFNDNGRIHVVFNNHRLGKGVLRVDFHSEVPNAIYPDGIQDLYEPQPLDIELVGGAGDCATAAEVEVLLPYIKGDKGEKLTYADLTAQDKADLIAPIKEGIDKAITEKQDKLSTTADFELEENLLSLTDIGKRRLFDDLWASIKGTKLANDNYRMGADGKELTYAEALVRYERNGFIVRWNAACGQYGRYNEATGCFELNGLTDITYEQAIAIYQAGRPNNPDEAFDIYYHKAIRTNLPWLNPMTSGCGESFFACAVETIRVVHPSGLNITGLYCFSYCSQLHTIIGKVQFNMNDGFAGCSKLVSVNARMGKSWATLNFSNCPLLSIESIRYSIANSQPCTITLHPDAYARVTDEMFTLAGERQITIAST